MSAPGHTLIWHSTPNGPPGSSIKATTPLEELAMLTGLTPKRY